MLITPVAHIDYFVRELNHALKNINDKLALTRCQRLWLSAVVTGIAVTNRLCWATFERRSLGLFGQERLRWMFRRGKIAWPWLLRASTSLIIECYRITGGTLVIDDTDKIRSKNTTKISGAHKVKHKGSSGYINGQELIFMALITDKVTLPVCFKFYQPDPVITQWRKQNKRLKKSGVPCSSPTKATSP